MTRQEHLLTILIEECNETAQRATKALRFGLEEVQPEQDATNAERIVYEFNDIVAVMELLYAEGGLPKVFDAVSAGLKKVKIEKYFSYSSNCGTVNS